jgi:hypothetical protein
MLFFTQLCSTPKPGILALCEELPLCPSVNLDTLFNISKPDARGKRGSFSITPLKNYLIDIYMGGS